MYSTNQIIFTALTRATATPCDTGPAAMMYRRTNATSDRRSEIAADVVVDTDTGAVLRRRGNRWSWHQGSEQSSDAGGTMMMMVPRRNNASTKVLSVEHERLYRDSFNEANLTYSITLKSREQRACGKHVGCSKVSWTWVLGVKNRNVRVEFSHSRLSRRWRLRVDRQLVFCSHSKPVLWHECDIDTDLRIAVGAKGDGERLIVLLVNGVPVQHLRVSSVNELGSPPPRGPGMLLEKVRRPGEPQDEAPPPELAISASEARTSSCSSTGSSSEVSTVASAR